MIGSHVEDDGGMTVQSGNGVEEGHDGLGRDITAEVQADVLPLPRTNPPGVQFQHRDRAGGRAQQGE